MERPLGARRAASAAECRCGPGHSRRASRTIPPNPAAARDGLWIYPNRRAPGSQRSLALRCGSQSGRSARAGDGTAGDPATRAGSRAGLDFGRQGVAGDAGPARSGNRPGIPDHCTDCRRTGMEHRMAAPLAARSHAATSARRVDPGAGFQGGNSAGGGGRGDGAGHGLLPHRWRRDAGPLHGGLTLTAHPSLIYTPPMKTKALPGFRDFYPTDLALRSHIFNTSRAVATRYGFEEYDGPPLEPLDLYTTKSGEEIVGQLYNFTDKGDRPVALRPEMTPTLARMVAARAGELKKPIRWFSIPQLFRYERQQRGRLREHFQLNCDLIGEPGPLGDAEIIALAIDVMRAFGLGPADVRVRLSDRRVLRALLLGAGVTEPQLGTAYQAVDKIERAGREALGAQLAEGGVAAG